MKKWLFNPFVYIAGMRALLIGLAIMILTIIVATFSDLHFIGILKIRPGEETSLQCTIELLTSWACLVICLYILARIASDSSIRFIDIAGTFALARWPMLLIAFLGFIPTPQIDEQKMSLKDLSKITEDPAVIIQSLIGLVLMIWLVTLLYNAFSVSTNLKGRKATWTFIAGLVMAEILSRVILIYAFNK